MLKIFLEIRRSFRHKVAMSISYRKRKKAEHASAVAPERPQEDVATKTVSHQSRMRKEKRVRDRKMKDLIKYIRAKKNKDDKKEKNNHDNEDSKS